MKTIKFKGKATMTVEQLDEIGIGHDNGWVIGNLISNGGNPFIVGDLIDVTDEYIAHDFWVSVRPESVGQYTGVNDNNGVEIYVRDVVSIDEEGYDSIISEVVSGWADYPAFDLPGYDGYGTNAFTAIYYSTEETIEVIGNVYDNPELLTKGGAV